MRKTTLLLFFIAFYSGTYAFEIDSTGHKMRSYADDTAGTSKKHEKHNYLAVNATFFLKQFLNFATSSVNVSSSPYIFDYRYVGDKHSGFRLSAGVAYNETKTTIPSTQSPSGLDETDKEAILNFSYRLGYVYQKKIARRWTVIAGVDLIGSVTDSSLSVNTSQDVSSSKSIGWSLGFGPSLGIQFEINKRMGLFTEAAIYYTHGTSTSSNTDNNFPQNNGEISTSSNGLNFIVPLSIYYYIRF